MGHFSCVGRTFSRLHDDHSAAGRPFSRTAAGAGDAGRKISRTGLRNMATLKPTTPLHTHNKGPMKPPSPLHPKSAAKTPISHPQRRWRFQLAHLTGPQRRRRFQTTRPPGRQSQAAAPAGPEAMSSPAISHLVPFTRTWARWHARGPLIPHVNPMTCAWAAPPTCRSRGLRAHQRVNAHVQGLACEQHSTTGTIPPHVGGSPSPNGGNASLEIRHAGDTPTASL